jgi:hypothetical protein
MPKMKTMIPAGKRWLVVLLVVAAGVFTSAGLVYAVRSAGGDSEKQSLVNPTSEVIAQAVSSPSVTATVESTSTVTPEPTATSEPTVTDTSLPTETPAEIPTVTEMPESLTLTPKPRLTTVVPSPVWVVGNPCSLLTKTEVQTALGQPVRDPFTMSIPGTTRAACVYSTVSSGKPQYLTVNVDDQTKITPVVSKRPYTPGPNDPQPVSGIGDNASWTWHTNNGILAGGLAIGKGRWVLFLTTTNFDQNTALSVSLNLARIALPRLP